MGGLDLMCGVNDGVEVIFFPETIEREDIISDGIFNVVCHAEGVEGGN